MVNGLLPNYLQPYIEVPSQGNYPLRSVSAGRKSFFPYCIDEWNKHNPDVRNAKFIYKFQKSIKIEKLENSFYNDHDPFGVKLLSRLRLQFSNLNKHKFRHGFNGKINPMCPCGTEVEINEDFLLRCHCFSSQRSAIFDNLYNLDPSFSELNDKEKVAYL